MLPLFGLLSGKLHPIGDDIGVTRPEKPQKIQRWLTIREAR